VIIAIDGPAGSGKSTVAREVAKRLGLRYLDTGAMYRAVTLLALEAGLIPERISEAQVLAASTPIKVIQQENDLARVFVGDREVSQEIRGPLVSRHVSAVSADPGVRSVLTERQRQEAATGDVVLEGRDMGTVVVPQAEVKVFLTASVEERARRRQLQLAAQGIELPLEQIANDLRARDAYDSGRALAPLKKADDAIEIDTTAMSVEQVVNAVCALALGKGCSRTGWKLEEGGEKPERWPLCGMVRSRLDTRLYRVAYSFIPWLWRHLFRMHIEGAENVPLTGPVVLACNHRSNLDPFFLGSACPRMVHFMAKAELWKSRALGWLVERMGAFPVKRGEADREAVRRALEVLEAGAVLGVFPEGKRHREPGLGEIQPGVSLFSLREGVLTVPVVMTGTERAVRNHCLRFPRVRVAFGPPIEIPSKDLPRAERGALVVQRLTDAMKALLTEVGEKQ